MGVFKRALRVGLSMKKDRVVRGLKLKERLPYSGICVYTQTSLFPSDSADLAVVHIVYHTGLYTGPMFQSLF